VNGVEPAGVAPEVEIVNTDDFDVSAAAKLTVAGLNEAVAPAGRADVTLKFAENGVPVAPFRVTVTEYVALPAVPAVRGPV